MKNFNEPIRVVYTSKSTKVFGKDAGNLLFTMSKSSLDEREQRTYSRRIVSCVNALEGIEDPIKMRETWDVVKELELDAFHKLKQEHDQFIELVRAMRDNQKEYFRNRTRESLLQSKELERKVDLLLIPTDKHIQQTELFNK